MDGAEIEIIENQSLSKQFWERTVSLIYGWPPNRPLWRFLYLAFKGIEGLVSSGLIFLLLYLFTLHREDVLFSIMQLCLFPHSNFLLSKNVSLSFSFAVFQFTILKLRFYLQVQLLESRSYKLNTINNQQECASHILSMAQTNKNLEMK